MRAYPLDGDFDIDNVAGGFYLRENGAWAKKGKFVRDNITGLWTDGPFPYTASQHFELAKSDTAQHFYQAFSIKNSKVTAAYAPQSALNVILTDSLSGYLGKGKNIICTAHFTPASQTATLTFNDVYVPAFAPLWCVLPATADPAFAGLQALWAGEPQ